MNNRFGIPNSINIGGVVYRVEFASKDEIEARVGEPCCAGVEYLRKRISLKSDQIPAEHDEAEPQAWNSLLHEIRHVLLRNAGHGKATMTREEMEITCNYFAEIVDQLLTSNPWIAEHWARKPKRRKRR